MGFNEAIQQLKNGKKISRSGWNGKKQCVCLATMERAVLSDGTILLNPLHNEIGANFLMFVGTSGYQCGWLASQADMLADDWGVVEC